MLKTLLLPARSGVASFSLPPLNRRTRVVSISVVVTASGNPSVPLVGALGGGVATLWELPCATPLTQAAQVTGTVAFQAVLAQDPVTGAGTIDFPAQVGSVAAVAQGFPVSMAVRVNALLGGSTASHSDAAGNGWASIALPECWLEVGTVLYVTSSSGANSDFGTLVMTFEDGEE